MYAYAGTTFEKAVQYMYIQEEEFFEKIRFSES